MKNLKILLLSAIGILVLTSFQQSEKSGYTLTVNFKNISSNDGVVLIAMYNSESSWLKTGKVYKNCKAPISNKSAQYVFKDLPAGTYAISSFHDKNSNNKLDTNVLGIPSEDYGFSNNAPAIFGPASFNKSKFTLKGDKTITINF